MSEEQKTLVYFSFPPCGERRVVEQQCVILMSCCVKGFTVCPIWVYFGSVPFNIVVVSVEHPSHATSFICLVLYGCTVFYDTTLHT